MPKPLDGDTKQVVFNMNALPLDVEASGNGVRTTSLTSEKAPVLGELGLSAKLVKLDANAAFSLGYLADAAVQLIYVIRGSGHVEITGLNGASAMKAKVEAGFLFVVPKLFVVSQIAADGEGMEWFSVITTPQPVFSQFAGKTSMFKALSPSLVEAAFNVDPELVKLLRSGGSSL
ncbi:hypothetical protein ACLOJK_009750 [Asimina triloba]